MNKNYMQVSVATNSVFQNPVDAITRFSFLPMISNSATDFDGILTCMENFKEVLQQQNQDYGTLWCDEVASIGPPRSFKYLILINVTIYFLFWVVSSRKTFS